MEKKLPKVLICIPNLGTINVKLVTLIYRWLSDNQGAWHQIALMAPKGLIPHDNARNFCVKEFLKTDFDYLFFIDADVIPPFKGLKTLLERDVDIVCGAYPSIRLNTKTGEDKLIYNIFRHELNDETGETEFKNVIEESGLHEVDSTGAGCLLIKRKVLEKMRANWFRFGYWDDGLIRRGEDIAFCDRAREMGFKVYGDFDVVCKHFKTILL